MACPVRPEPITLAVGARIADFNLGYPHPVQAHGVDSLQIQVVFVPPLLDELPNLLAVGGQHGLGHILIGLKMAQANVGADGCPDVLRLAAEILHHGLHGLRANFLGGTPPTGVSRPHRPGHRVKKQHRGAVGGEHQQRHLRGVRHESVALGVIFVAEAPAVPVGDHPDDVRMGLPGHHQLLRVKAQGTSQPPEVFHHVFHGVPPAVGQIQAGLGAGAHPAIAGGEAVGDGNSPRGQKFNLVHAFRFYRHSDSP